MRSAVATYTLRIRKVGVDPLRSWWSPADVRHYVRFTPLGEVLVTQLVHCPHCSRHFKRAEPVCPFCGAPAADATFSVRSVTLGASRSRVYVAGATVLVSAVFTACTDGGRSSIADGRVGDTGETNATGTPSHEAKSTESGSEHATTGSTNPNSDDSTADADSTASETLVPGEVCPGFTLRTQGGARCDQLDQCPSGLVCSNGPVYTTSAIPNCVVNPCACNPVLLCNPATCAGSCVSDGTPCGQTCVPPCSPETCTGSYECVDEVCVPKPCDGDGGGVCAMGYRCDPSSANATEAGCVVIPCNEPDGLECAEAYRCAPDEPGANAQGCVYKQCDEEDGPTCLTNMVCRPDDETAWNDGCAYPSCDEDAATPCPEYHACRPEAENAVSNGQARGCSALRCDEAGGRPCATGSHCAPDAEKADALGCVITRCDEGFACDPWKRCDPMAIGAGADSRGCIVQRCSEDADCACGFCVNLQCSPEPYTCWAPEIVATPYGCVWPDDEWV